MAGWEGKVQGEPAELGQLAVRLEVLQHTPERMTAALVACNGGYLVPIQQACGRRAMRKQQRVNSRVAGHLPAKAKRCPAGGTDVELRAGRVLLL